MSVSELIDKARENLMNMTEEEREELFKKCKEWNTAGPLVSVDLEDYSVQDCYNDKDEFFKGC